MAAGLYEFTARSEPNFPLADIAGEIEEEINSMEGLKFDSSEVDFMAKMPWFREDYIEWLADSKIRPKRQVEVEPQRDGSIRIEVAGNWHETILYEVPILAIVEEIYCAKASGLSPDQAEHKALSRLPEKIALLNPHPRLTFTDFGTRRRYSARNHKAVLAYLKDNCSNLVGTSNVWLAKKLGLKAIGTVAHEWFMAHMSLVDRLEEAQKRALHVWLQEYGENLGTALTDTFGTSAFWRDFDPVLARAFSGVRHDSGNPFQFGFTAIEQYKKMGIDPRTKTIVFSDSLDFPKMVALFETFTGTIGVSFGIGTNLMNDVGFNPLSIVMKLMSLNGRPLVKISDVAGKIMGSCEMVEKVCAAYKIYA